jgi:hypothetical protein
MVQYLEILSNEIVDYDRIYVINYQDSPEEYISENRDEFYDNMPSLEYDYYYPSSSGYYYSDVQTLENEEQQDEQQQEEVYQPLIYSNNFTENYPYQFDIRLNLPSFINNSSQINSQ